MNKPSKVLEVSFNSKAHYTNFANDIEAIIVKNNGHIGTGKFQSCNIGGLHIYLAFFPTEEDANSALVSIDALDVYVRFYHPIRIKLN